MARYSFQSNKKTGQPPAPSSPAPAISPIIPIPALDLEEYRTEPGLYVDGPQRSLFQSPEPDQKIYGQTGQPRASFLEGSSFTGTYDANALISRESFHAAANRTSLFATPPPMGTTTRNPSSVPDSPYLSYFITSSDDIVPAVDIPPLPTSPTAEALAELGPAPGMGPTTTARQHRNKMQRIIIWAEEMAEVNETQPTKPMPKPLRDWERLGRRVLKRRELDEWPGPMQDGEKVDKTEMYGGERRTLSGNQYFGPHPSLNRGDGTDDDTGSLAPPILRLDDDSPAFPTRNILIDNVDGPADSPDGLKLSPVTTSSNGRDLVKKAKNATDERLQRAAKLLAKQTKKMELDAESPSGDEEDVVEKAHQPPQRKKYMDLMEYRRSLLLQNGVRVSTFSAT